MRRVPPKKRTTWDSLCSLSVIFLRLSLKRNSSWKGQMMSVPKMFICYFTQTETLFVLVNGRWSAWLSWGACSRTCGGGAKRRSRTCTNPPPRNGGAACSGGKFQTRRCNSNGCPGTFLMALTLAQSAYHLSSSNTFVAWEKSRHFATPSLVYFPATWRPTNGRSNFIRMTVTTQIWGVVLFGWSKFPTRIDQSEALPRSG